MLAWVTNEAGAPGAGSTDRAVTGGMPLSHFGGYDERGIRTSERYSSGLTRYGNDGANRPTAVRNASGATTLYALGGRKPGGGK